MKRMMYLILAFCLLFSGCSTAGDRMKEPVTFYYVSASYRKDMQQVIGSEMREAAGHKDDLSYLLALYSMGPTTEGLKSPLPRNTRIIPADQAEDRLELHLSEGALTMSDADFTLAGACIAMTCMELTGVQQVTVSCEDKSVTIQEDNLLLYSSTQQMQQEETA